jgi:DNA primase
LVCVTTKAPGSCPGGIKTARKSDTAFVDGGEVGINRPEKVLSPDDGFTKGDLISYYRDVGPWMLPYLKQRPLTMERYPDGIDQEGFFQKKLIATILTGCGR